MGTEMTFKMIIYPTKRSATKGGASFKAAKGKGCVQLKCEGDLESCFHCVTNFQISVGSGRGERALYHPPRGPLRHDFRLCSTCAFPNGQYEWDFSGVVDVASETFVVCLEVFS